VLSPLPARMQLLQDSLGLESLEVPVRDGLEVESHP